MYEMDEREVAAVRAVVRSGHTFRYRGGEGGFCDRFEAALRAKVGVKHAILTSSGTGALISAMAGLGLGPGDEVIVPAYTFMATALAPLAVGAVPVIVDIDESCTVSPSSIRRAITKRTKAVIPVHMCGWPCDMDAVMKIAREHKLKVCEDACQGVGGTYKGRMLGSIGHAGAYSFNHFKNLSCGEGGALLTHDPMVYDRALIYHDGGCVFRNHAGTIKVPFFPGLNFRASEFQGAIMGVQLGRLEGILRRLRDRKRAMVEELARSRRFSLCPLHDKRGECGSATAIAFDDATSADAFVATGKAIVPMHTLFDSGRHIFSNWEPVMKRRYHHEAINPWKLAGNAVSYPEGMCAKTLDIVKRTVVISTPYKITVPQARALGRKLGC